MIHKRTFASDNDLNQFFQENSINGESTVYIIKVIIVYNPVEHCQEQHLFYSEKSVMKAGQHLRKGVPQI